MRIPKILILKFQDGFLSDIVHLSCNQNLVPDPFSTDRFGRANLFLYNTKGHMQRAWRPDGWIIKRAVDGNGRGATEIAK